MKISLDLLPEEIKKEIRKGYLLRKIVWFEMVFLFPVFVMAVILLDNLYVLNIEKESVANIYAMEQNQDKYKQLGMFQDSFKKTNELVSSSLSYQKKHLHWLAMLDEISSTIPENVFLSNITTQDLHLIMVGKAKSRESLLKFQSQLQQSACFKDVNVPLSDMVQKSDIDFQIDFNVKTECLVKKI